MCHLCGRWFTHLGAHLRRHGWTARGYRQEVGLALHVPLCSAKLSARIAARQQAAYPGFREILEPGQGLARSGELQRLAAAAARLRDERGAVPAAQADARHGRLAAGRRTVAARRRQRLDLVVEAAKARDLDDLLRQAYQDGASLADLVRRTGLGRSGLRAALIAAGVQIRPTGRNRPTSKTARARSIDAAVAVHVGADDIRKWLLQRRAAGGTLRVLADETGRSIPWVRSRLSRRNAATTTGDGSIAVRPRAARPSTSDETDEPGPASRTQSRSRRQDRPSHGT